MINPNNDADLLTLQLESKARQISQLRRKGFCTHERRQGNGDPANETGKSTCLECGKVSTWEGLEDERRELLM